MLGSTSSYACDCAPIIDSVHTDASKGSAAGEAWRAMRNATCGGGEGVGSKFVRIILRGDVADKGGEQVCGDAPASVVAPALHAVLLLVITAFQA